MSGGKEVLFSVSAPNHLSILQGEPFQVVSYCYVIHQVPFAKANIKYDLFRNIN